MVNQQPPSGLLGPDVVRRWEATRRRDLAGRRPPARRPAGALTPPMPDPRHRLRPMPIWSAGMGQAAAW